MATAPARPPGTLNDVVVTNPGGGDATLPERLLRRTSSTCRATHVVPSLRRALFRRGMTGGCGGGNYCPDAAVTREQMAVFLLDARRAAGLRAAALRDADVRRRALRSPFARWIEELARRGVTGGCGGGNYCPAGAVTREQMAVFLLRPSSRRATCRRPARPPRSRTCPAPAASRRWIYELVARGITGGCGAANYCPLPGHPRADVGLPGGHVRDLAGGAPRSPPARCAYAQSLARWRSPARGRPLSRPAVGYDVRSRRDVTARASRS